MVSGRPSHLASAGMSTEYPTSWKQRNMTAKSCPWLPQPDHWAVAGTEPNVTPSARAGPRNDAMRPIVLSSHRERCANVMRRVSWLNLSTPATSSVRRAGLCSVCETSALVEGLERKGILTGQEVLDMIQELRRCEPTAIPPRRYETPGRAAQVCSRPTWPLVHPGHDGHLLASVPQWESGMGGEAG